MKVRNTAYQQKASRIFTDREEPRKAFWKHYHQSSSEAPDNCDIHVLTYYGIGGIGKTRLLKKIMEEMDARLSGQNYVYFDFSLQQESRSVLTALKNKLCDEFDFSFPLFELGSYIYAKKTGADPNSIEIKRLTEKSPFLNLLMNVMGKIPATSVATQLLSLADQFTAYLATHLKKHSREIRQIEYLETEELYRRLPYFFALDMTQNQEQRKMLLVIFLDTYERLVNELSNIGEPLNNDLWLRGDQGLIQNIPQVLWVIAGREKLKWEQFNPEWHEALDQHILGNLSLADSDTFLKSTGICNDVLRRQLYELTNGTPVYLDLCVDQFDRLCANGFDPDISMFGKDTYQLIERFIRYMSDAQKDLVYLLSCLQTWNHELIIELANYSLPNFSLTTYEKTMNFSFIIKSNDEWYSIHQTVGEIVVEHCPPLLKERITTRIIQLFSQKISDLDVFSEYYPTYLSYILQSGILLYDDANSLRTFFLESIRRPWDRLIRAGQFDEAERLLDIFFDHAHLDQSTSLYAVALSEKAYLKLNTGSSYSVCEELADSAFQLSIKTLGKDHPDTLHIGNTLSMIYYTMNNLDRAQILTEYIYQHRLNLYGKEHPDTIYALNNLGLIYQRTGRHSKALNIAKDVLAMQRSRLGENHIDTLRAMGVLASALLAAKKPEDALNLLKIVLSHSISLLTKSHPDTIFVIHKIATTYEQLEDYPHAAEYYEQAWLGYQETLGDGHPQTYYVAHSFAIALVKIGDHDRAIELYMQILHDFTERFSMDRSATHTMIKNSLFFMSVCPVHHKQVKRLHSQLVLNYITHFCPIGSESEAFLHSLGYGYSYLRTLQSRLQLLQDFSERFGEDSPEFLSLIKDIDLT